MTEFMYIILNSGSDSTVNARFLNLKINTLKIYPNTHLPVKLGAELRFIGKISKKSVFETPDL